MADTSHRIMLFSLAWAAVQSPSVDKRVARRSTSDRRAADAEATLILKVGRCSSSSARPSGHETAVGAREERASYAARDETCTHLSTASVHLTEYKLKVVY